MASADLDQIRQHHAQSERAGRVLRSRRDEMISRKIERALDAYGNKAGFTGYLLTGYVGCAALLVVCLIGFGVLIGWALFGR